MPIAYDSIGFVPDFSQFSYMYVPLLAFLLYDYDEWALRHTFDFVWPQDLSQRPTICRSNRWVSVVFHV